MDSSYKLLSFELLINLNKLNMNSKTPCWHRFVPLVLTIAALSFFSSCQKGEAVSPDTPTTVNSTTAIAPKTMAFVSTASAAVRTYEALGVVSLSGASNRTINAKSIGGFSAALLTLSNCHDITISNCKFYNSANAGIYLYNCYNITITGNYFTNVSTGVNAVQCPAGGIVVSSNQFLNMQGPFPGGQFVQFNNVNGPNNKINSNIGENILGHSNPEDAISLYESNGTAASPITINGNAIRGGGPSASGGGIMLGDSGGSYLVADGNILVNPGQYGMAISGGSHNSITNNLIYGVSQSFTNIGLYVETIGSSPITNSTVSGNRVNFYNSTGAHNGAWMASGIATPSGWSSNNWSADIDSSILPATLITNH